MRRKLRRFKLRKCGLFKPTKEKITVFVVAGVLLVILSYLQRQAVLANGSTPALILAGILGNTVLLISTVLGFYSLVCLIMYFAKK